MSRGPGRRARRWTASSEDQAAPDADPLCPLCGRPITAASRASLHHLTPVLKGGRSGPTARIHQICHNEIHAALTEAELAREYSTFEALRAHPKLARFIAWVADKPPHFHKRSTGNHRRRRKERR